MMLLESKVMQTKFETEIFIDQSSNIELCNFHYPEKGFPYYELLIGMEFMRIRGNEFYGMKKNYFGIRMTEDLKTITVFEPDQQSLFSVKDEQEKQAASELIDYILTESPNFKQQLVRLMNNKLKQTNGVIDTNTKESKAALMLFERLLKISYEEVRLATKQKITA